MIVRKLFLYSLPLVASSTAIGILAATANYTEIPAPESPRHAVLVPVRFPILAHARVPAEVEPAWMTAFRKQYDLKEGEYVKRVGPPYPEDAFYEPTGSLHRVSRNPSAKGTTRILAVVLYPRDAKQIAVPEAKKP